MIGKQIKHKRQLIETLSEGTGNKYKYRIKYFPAGLETESKCAWKMIQSSEWFTSSNDAIKAAKTRIDLELEKGKWTYSTVDVFNGYKEGP